MPHNSSEFRLLDIKYNPYPADSIAALSVDLGVSEKIYSKLDNKS
jgi:hypothetical protein